ncbi:hypothetical protein Hanom_Chr01g00023361 [Helianthus anomalus]
MILVQPLVLPSHYSLVAQHGLIFRLFNLVSWSPALCMELFLVLYWFTQLQIFSVRFSSTIGGNFDPWPAPTMCCGA